LRSITNATTVALAKITGKVDGGWKRSFCIKKKENGMATLKYIKHILKQIKGKEQ